MPEEGSLLPFFLFFLIVCDMLGRFAFFLGVALVQRLEFAGLITLELIDVLALASSKSSTRPIHTTAHNANQYCKTK